MSYSQFEQFIDGHLWAQLVWLGLCWIINYYFVYWGVSLLKPEWATESFEFWLGLICITWCFIGCIILTLKWLWERRAWTR